ncbi:MAG: tetratricopeptide repeat protein [Planctomycetes bacterium]|nr:tetratricopeptide repeat protein [Planctomycetota bacterium]
MRTLGLVCGGALAGALSTAVVAALLADAPPSPPRPAAASEPGGEGTAIAGPQPGSTGFAVRFERLEQRLEELTGVIEGLRAELGARREAVGPPRGIDAESLAAALTDVERDRWGTMSLAELQREADRLQKKAGDLAAARRVLEFALERPLAPGDRAALQARLGSIARRAGDGRTAEIALSRAIDVLGTTNDDGAWAAYELALTRSEGGDHAAALALGRRFADQPNVSEWIRRHGRWVVATELDALGDRARARSEYEAILAACADDRKYDWLVTDVQQRLASLR